MSNKQTITKQSPDQVYASPRFKWSLYTTLPDHFCTTVFVTALNFSQAGAIKFNSMVFSVMSPNIAG